MGRLARFAWKHGRAVAGFFGAMARLGLEMKKKNREKGKN